MAVDDNPINLEVLCGILEEAAYAVRPALSGELALQAIDTSPPDLILLDICMPDMDGYETCSYIKNNERTRHIPIIFISALDDIEDKLKAFQAGGVDYITKPFQPDEVLARVKTQIELANARRSLAESNDRLVALMEQLIQSEKLKSLGSLAAGVAHELNTPVGNALLTAGTIDAITREFASAHATGNAQLNIDELISTCSECAQLITRNLEKAAKLIRSLRQVAADEQSERRRSIALHECVNDMIATMQFSIKKTRHIIKNEVPLEFVIETYPGRLEQILDNLICNAIIHGFDGIAQGTITLSAGKNKTGGIDLVISDNGKGIPAENLKQIFDPFFTTRLGQGGSGLGLHIVYNLATGILGGTINVESTPNQGTRFTLALPLIAPINQPQETAA